MKYIDREGTVTVENTSQDRLLQLLYTHGAGRLLLKAMVQPAVSRAGGWFLSRKCSKVFIRPFVNRQQIDLTLYEKQDFDSYNDFFTRRIKKACRPLEGDRATLISPCDGKLSIYPIDGEQRFSIKHTEYTLESLLHSRSLARRYEGGHACIFRLTVDDYHRYCYVDDGIKSPNYRIPGIFHTVNPIANDVTPIYKENAREFSLLQSRHFGTVLMMEVGALLVGKITNYHGPCKVSKGQEKGRFEFGGSTVVLLFQKNTAAFEARLTENTRQGYETLVKMGECLGTSAICPKPD